MLEPSTTPAVEVGTAEHGVSYCGSGGNTGGSGGVGLVPVAGDPESRGAKRSTTLGSRRRYNGACGRVQQEKGASGEGSTRITIRRLDSAHSLITRYFVPDRWIR